MTFQRVDPPATNPIPKKGFEGLGVENGGDHLRTEQNDFATHPAA